MKKIVVLSIGLAFALAAVAQAKQAEGENPKNKKSKPAPQQQVAPKQHMAPQQHMAPKQQSMSKHQPVSNPQVQAMPKQHHNPNLQTEARVHHNNVQKQQLNQVPVVKPNKHAVVQQNTVPAVQSNNVRVNRTVQNYQPRHQNFHARVNPAVTSAQFNQNYRIRNAQNWSGAHYNAFRTYQPQWHDRSWWSSHHSHITLIGGGWYYWNSGYWYPAWGYDTSAAYYPYDGPIYVGSHPRPFDQVVADVQSILQEQGYYRGEVDGLVGPLTQEALAAYQSSQGLPPTASIDQPTLESLGIS